MQSAVRKKLKIKIKAVHSILGIFFTYLYISKIILNANICIIKQVKTQFYIHFLDLLIDISLGLLYSSLCFVHFVFRSPNFGSIRYPEVGFLNQD